MVEHDAPLLNPIDPPEAFGATLASRLHNIPGLESVLDRYRPTLPRPRLEPAWPLPDRPETTQPRHATSSEDGTIRLWQVINGTQHDVLADHPHGVRGCAFSPDGTRIATAGSDQKLRLWQVPDGGRLTTDAVLSSPDRLLRQWGDQVGSHRPAGSR